MSQFDSTDLTLSIVEIDEVLKDDAFFRNNYASDGLPDDVSNILKQWKQNEKRTLVGNHFANGSSKYVDTRTFTRPKKKSKQNLESTFLNLNSESVAEQDATMTPVNLKVGGLVTSLQTSFLAETTPPVYMDSSLITSNDFTNINFLSNEFDNNIEHLNNIELLGKEVNNFNGYNLNDVINDRKFLETLTLGDETFLKDENISRTECILYNDDSTGNSTLQNSEDFSMKSSTNGILNETFVPADNKVINNNNLNITVNLNNEDNLNKTHNIHVTEILKPEESENKENRILLNETFGVDLETTQISSSTFNQINNNTFENNKSDEILTPENLFKTQFKQRRSIVNFTPILNKTNRERDSVKEVDLESTPVTTPTSTQNNGTQENTTFTPENIAVALRKKEIVPPNVNFETNELNDFIDLNKTQNLILLQEEERRSLINFEEFEKSIQLLENGGEQSEKEFDDILNSLGNIENKLINEKMRQSLDNIKKRHSLLHLDKHEDIQYSNNNKFIKTSYDNLLDSNRLTDSMCKSMNSSTGSERLLNRRSRMYDGINKEVQDISSSLNHLNITQSIPQQIEIDATTQAEKGDKRDRDRFKTIRIFRKPQDTQLNLPDAADATVMLENGCSTPPLNTTDVLSTQQIENISPKSTTFINHEHEFKKPELRPVSNLVQPKHRTLSRPRYYGQQKPSYLLQPLKSSSADDLLDRNNCDNEQANPIQDTHESKIFNKHLISPMGVKAKSFHNIAGSNTAIYNSSNYNKTNTSKLVSKLSIAAPSRFGGVGCRENESKLHSNMRLPRASSLARQMPASKLNHGSISDNKNDQKSGISLRNNIGGVKKSLTTFRPTSAYYNSNIKQNESDNESERFSPNSLSSSSASSRGSLQQNELCKQSVDSLINRNREKSVDSLLYNETTLLSSNPSSNLIQNKTSGIRPPSNLRQPTVRSGLPRPTGIPRR